MRYYVSSITDVISEEADGDWEKLTYVDRTAELVSANGLGIELAEFCISDNMDNSYEDVLPHVLKNCEASPDRTLHAPYNELFPMAIEPLVVEVAYKRYVQTLDYCKRFGAKKMIVHANYTEALYFPNWFIKRHIDFWKRFLAENDLGDVVICVENVQEEDPDLILGILKGVEDPRLRMCLDVGHANLSDTEPIEWECRAEQGYILANWHGQHNALLGLDFLAVADAGNASAHIDNTRRDSASREVGNAYASRRNTTND